MKIIDLLNKIANGEEVPKKIKYINKIFDYDNADYFNTDIGYLFERCTLFVILNDEVEILEEKKLPEKIIPTSLKGIDNLDEKIEIAHIDTISVIETLNQVIDYLKSKGDE